LIVTKQHIAQGNFEDTDEEGDALDELSEFEWLLIDTALDVISGLAIALGADFASLWPLFEKTVLRYAGGAESIERSTAVGVMAEIATGMGAAVTPLTTKFLQVLMRRLTDEDMQTRSNAAYAVGRLVEKSNSDREIVNAYPSILEKVESCLRVSEARLPDNAAGCLSRMILKHKDKVPIADVLPALVAILPLKNDFDENEPLYRMICQMCKFLSGSFVCAKHFSVSDILLIDKWEDETVRSLTPRLIPVFQAVLTGDSDQLEDERRAELIELVAWLNKMHPGGPASWIEQLAQ
jgi:hypothetical protein